MPKSKHISLKQREKALSELLQDAINLNFNKHLIKNYEKQLKEIRLELDKLKEKQKEFSRLLKLKEAK